jgi:anti-sigma factor RsiW
MNDSDIEALLEESWRRPLTEEEQIQLTAWLATRPDARAAWEEEAALNRSLQGLPDAPLSSNFTSLVLQAVERETRATSRAKARPAAFSPRWWWRRLAWGTAWGLVAISAISVAMMQHKNKELSARQVATGLAVLANVTTLSEPAVLEDFDAIQRLSLTSSEDEDLYAVLNN